MSQRNSRTMEVHVTKDMGCYTVFDAFADVFTPPENLSLHRAEWGYEARVGDAMRIRHDVESAARALGLEHGLIHGGR